MKDIERELEETLHRVLDPIAARPIPRRRELHDAGAFRTIAGGAGAALALKMLGATAAFAAVVSVTGASLTGSFNPADWGPQVSSTVQTCRDDLNSTGGNGIGPCVSAFASQHGSAVSAAAQHHDNSGNGGGSSNGNGKPSGAGNENGNGTGNGNGHSKAPTKPQTRTPPPKS
jgi:hypothetical protein